MDFEIISIGEEIYYLLFSKSAKEKDDITIRNNRFVFRNHAAKNNKSTALDLVNAEIKVKNTIQAINKKYSSSKLSRRVSSPTLFPEDFIVHSYKSLLFSNKNKISVEVTDKKLLHKINIKSFVFEFLEGKLSSISFPEFDLNKIV